MSFAGHGSMALLLGLFQVSILHNIVHLLFGIVGLVASRTASGSRLYLLVGGIVYAVLFVFGLFTAGMTSGANFVPLNSADNVLHAFLAVAMIVLGLSCPVSGRPAPADPCTTQRRARRSVDVPFRVSAPASGSGSALNCR